MKRTEYVTLQDQTLIDLFQQLGEDVSNLELIDEEKISMLWLYQLVTGSICWNKSMMM